MKAVAIVRVLGLGAIACSNSTAPTRSTMVDACAGYGGQGQSAYVLPYAVGEAHLLIQGNCGSFSHYGALRYAYDFRMPIGHSVTAARAGTVVFVEDGFPDGTGRLGDENLVIVRGPDGSFDRYIHLTQRGASVPPGASVHAGDLIGRSGNSGYSTEPHLHFDVTVGCSTLDCPTVPLVFRNTTPHAGGLQAGTSYPALPY